MPQGDRTGPAGAGPRTGRGLGYCSGFDAPGYGHPGYRHVRFGRGRAHGRGFGRRYEFFDGPPGPPVGWGYPAYTPRTREETLSDLRANADWLTSQLDTINKRIEALEKPEE